jgi:hypothetical protein
VAMARPIPFEAPVTRTALPSKRSSMPGLYDAAPGRPGPWI